MATVCEICGKGVTTGNKIVRRGLAKKKGGIGMHTTAMTRRRFKPNLQSVRVRDKNGATRKRRVCAACIKAGKVVKA